MKQKRPLFKRFQVLFLNKLCKKLEFLENLNYFRQNYKNLLNEVFQVSLLKLV